MTEKQYTTIWQFPRISPVKQREGFYCKESIAHPAKMPTYLARAIILTYTHEGDIILDPMAGIGTTVIEAVRAGRNAIGIEYEDRFVRLCNKNLRFTKTERNNHTGKGIFIKGDSRQLGKVLMAQEKIDSVIFSPPFANTLAGSSKDDVSRFRHGSAGKDYGDRNDPTQIGNLKHIQMDSIIFSPPYGHESYKSQDNKSRLCNEIFGYAVPYSEQLIKNRNASEINIGLQKGKTYMGEMLKIYSECYKALKQDGFMILVVKNFRRKGEEINLANDTIKLCKLAGFRFFQTCIHVLNGASFWQINHAKKTPYLMLNLTEYVLVFKKPIEDIL
jgi:DNA modification methylase